MGLADYDMLLHPSHMVSLPLCATQHQAHTTSGKIDAAVGIEYIKRATAISTIESDKPTLNSNLWFDITGRTFSAKPTAPGLYINSGKKYIIR